MQRSEKLLADLPEQQRTALQATKLVGCIATTDVHEWGKIMLEMVLEPLGVQIVDGGINADPDTLAALAQESRADFIGAQHL